MIAVAALAVLTYLTFVFFAENFNPFAKPRLHVQRETWRYGLRMALAVLLGGVSVFALLGLMELPFQMAIAAGAVIASVLGLCFSIGKIRQVLMG